MITQGKTLSIVVIILLTALVFIVKLFNIQIISDEYKLAAFNNSIRKVIIYPARGLIYDRNGKLLVENQTAYDLMVVPIQMQDFDTLFLCKLFDISREEIVANIQKARLYSKYKPSPLIKEIKPEKIAPFEERASAFKGFYIQPRILRKYPMSTAPHLLGYIGEVDEAIIAQNPEYKMGDLIGVSGIEKTYESILRGRSGVKFLLVDVHNRIVGSFQQGTYDTASIPGKNIYLTIDADLQMYAETLMANKRGSVVALDPRNGEILALVTSPFYNPNLIVGRERNRNYALLQKDSLKPLFNRALMAQYPPGSIFKLLDALIAQQEGVLRPETRYPCFGGYPPFGGKPKCHPHESHPDLRAAIRTSCNSYFTYVFRSIIDNRKKYRNTEEAYRQWRSYLHAFGIGQKLGTDLPYEKSGVVPSAEYYDKYFGKNRWTSATIYSLGIGQGELGILPLQMANVMAIIANKGYYYTPHVLKQVEDTPYDMHQYKVKHRVPIDTAYFTPVVEGMALVVERGTAALSKIPNIPFCGKTGTAQNPHGKDHSVFVCFAPKDNPKIALAVIVENAGFGATWAAPVASLIIEKYLTGTVKRKEMEQRIMKGNLLSYER